MRRKWLVLLVAAVVAVPLLSATKTDEGSKVFTVKMGPYPHFTSAQIGLNMGTLQPYVGFSMLAAGFNTKIGITSLMEDPISLKMVKVGAMDLDVEGSMSMLIPNVGFKYLFSTAESRPYLFASFYKSFASIDANMKTTLTLYDPTTGQKLDSQSDDQDLLDKDQKQLIEDLLSVWGVDVGFGVEWRVNKHFGIAGEYGFMYHKAGAKQEIKDFTAPAILDGGGTATILQQERTDVSLDLSGTLKSSKACVVLNFYF